MEMFDLSFKGALHKIEMDLSGQYKGPDTPPSVPLQENSTPNLEGLLLRFYPSATNINVNSVTGEVSFIVDGISHRFSMFALLETLGLR